MDIINEVINDRVLNLIGGKVEYYWEPDCYPTLEVFHQGTKGELLYKAEEVNELIRLAGVSEDKAEVDTESFDNNYHRIIIVMDFSITEEELLALVNVLKDYGNCIQEEV